MPAKPGSGSSWPKAARSPQVYEYASLWVCFSEEASRPGVSGCWYVVRWVNERGQVSSLNARGGAGGRKVGQCVAATGQWSRAFRQPKGSAVWTNTRRGAGWAGTTIRPCLAAGVMVPQGCKGGGWGKKAQISVPGCGLCWLHLLDDTRRWDETEIMHWSEVAAKAKPYCEGMPSQTSPGRIWPGDVGVNQRWY